MSNRLTGGLTGGLTRAALVASAIAAAGGAVAQDAGDFGKAEYTASCASCHGADGTGSGPVAQFLVKKPSDLTTLSKRNGGAFPNQLVWEMIDGRSSGEVGPHGSREMPVWGSTYRAQAQRQAGEPARGPEWYVRGRIVALLDYLARIQKP